MFSMLPVKELKTVMDTCRENGLEMGCTYMTELVEEGERTGFCIYDMTEENKVLVRFIKVPDDDTLIMTDTMLRAVMNRAEYAGCTALIFDESLSELLNKLKAVRGYDDETDIDSFLHTCTGCKN